MLRVSKDAPNRKGSLHSIDPASVPEGYVGDRLAKVESDVGTLWIPAHDGVMLPFIRRFGTWEPEEGAVLARLGTPKMRFLDIGANFGYFSRLIALRFPQATVDAFEPHPGFARLLRLNTWEFADRVAVWPTALGATRGTVGLSVAENNIGDTRTWSDQEDFEAVAPMSRLDDLITGRVDLVKMDVQGFEADVMLGMARTIGDNPRIQLIVEFWPSAIQQRGVSPQSVLSGYRSFGFSILLLRGMALSTASDDEVLLYCQSAGIDGQANLLLRRADAG